MSTLWKWLKAIAWDWWQKKKPDLPLPTSSTSSTPSAEWASAVFHVSPADKMRTLPVVCTITVTRRGSDYIIDTDKRELWPDLGDRIIGNVCLIMQYQGQWHCGPFDGMRPFPCTRAADAFCVPASTGARLVSPKSGDRVGIIVTGACRASSKVNPEQRSEIFWMVWP